MDNGRQMRRGVRHHRERREKSRGKESGEVEENANLGKGSVEREKLFFSLSPTPPLPVPAANQIS